MVADCSVGDSEEQLLGEIETRIVGMLYYNSGVQPGEQVNLEREPENPHDGRAIRVENGRFEPVGHLPHRLCSWLAPLVDSGKVRVDGYVPKNAPRPEERDSPRSPLTLSIFLCGKGKGLLAKREVGTKLDALHNVVRRAYEEVQGYTDADLILELADGLRPLARQELLPETRLLLAMMPAVAREVRVSQAFQAMAQMQELLGKITIGDPLHHHNLTIFPLAWKRCCEPPYELLPRAIERGEALVEEVDEHGEVANLGVTNRSDRPILIPEGEILIGAKQNRVVNITILVAARSRVILPVSCVEQGRWRYQSREFRAEACAPPSLRSKKMRSVQRNRQERASAESDQGEVWGEVAKGLDDLKVRSETGSLTDGFAAAEEKLREYRNQFQLPKDTAGIVVAQGEKIIGVDLFDCPQTLGTLWKRLSDAYFFDALRNRQRRRKTSRSAARKFVERVSTCCRPRTPTLGLGQELEVAGDGVVGAALLFADRVCHLSAFIANK